LARVRFVMWQTRLVLNRQYRRQPSIRDRLPRFIYGYRPAVPVV
jgi:hypothetical protein